MTNPQYDTNNVFAKIIRGKLPCHKIYENDSTLAFLNIHPSVEGHVLVIPKAPAENVWDLDDEDYQNLMLALRKVAKHLRQKLNVERVGVKVIGTDVPHTHIHLVPFNEGSEFYIRENKGEPDHAALASLAETLYFED